MTRHFISGIFCVFGAAAVLALTGDRPQRTCGTNCLQPGSSTERIGTHEVTAGRKVFIDPDTGKIIPRPPQVPAIAVTPEQLNARSTSSEGLREEPGATQGGGVKVHLQGRFRSTVVARVGENGQVTTRCQTGPEPQGSTSKP